MKKYKLLCLMLAFAVSVNAQTQRGYVKTLGRPEKEGAPLSGVTVRVWGEHNSVLSKEDGTFSMLLQDKKNGDAYVLQRVQKEGYELNEQGVIGRRYAFSDKVPLTIVMVSSAQLQADKRRIENKAYEVAQKNYRAKADLLERQRDEHKITIEQYREQIRDLQDKFEKYQSLIDDLAEHYAHVDYDGLEAKDREINICIENGELERADSLIRSMFDPVDVLKRNRERLSHIDQSEAQARELLEQANADMAAVLRQQAKDAEHLYQLYTISLAKFDNEKARYYIETRAELDTTNVEWQINAASFLKDLSLLDRSQHYLERALRISSRNHDELYSWEITVHCNLGDLFIQKGQYNEAMKYLEEARDSALQYFGADYLALSSIYNNMGLVYRKMAEYEKALELYRKALDIENHAHPDGSETIGTTYINIAALYSARREYERALGYNQMALLQGQKHAGEYSDLAATAYAALADIYYAMSEGYETRSNKKKRYKEAGYENAQKALDIYTRIYGTSHPGLAHVYIILGGVVESYDMSVNYLKKSIHIFETYYGEKHPFISTSLSVLSSVELIHGNADAALIFAQRAMDIKLQVYGTNHPDVADEYRQMTTIYAECKQYVLAIQNAENALKIYENGSYKKDKSLEIAECYSLIATSYMMLGELQKAMSYADKAVEVIEYECPQEIPHLYAYYLTQGACRLGLQLHELLMFRQSAEQNGEDITACFKQALEKFHNSEQMSGFDVEESFENCLEIVEKYYAEDVEEVQNVVGRLATVYFLKLMAASVHSMPTKDAYMEKLKTLGQKYPQFVQPVLANLQQQLGISQ